MNQAEQELKKVNEQIYKLNSSRTKIIAAMNELRDKCEVNESNSVAVFVSIEYKCTFRIANYYKLCVKFLRK